MDRRTLLAISLCFLIFVGWQVFLGKYYPQAQHPTEVSQTTSTQQNQALQQSQTQKSELKSQAKTENQRPPQSLKVGTGTGTATLVNGGPFIQAWELSKYKLGIGKDAPPVDLASVTNRTGEVTLAFDDPSLTYLHDINGDLTKTPQGAVWNYEDSRVKISREYFISENQPFIDVRIQAEFKEQAPRYAFISLESQGIEKDPEAQDRQVLYFTNQSVERVTLTDQVVQKQVSTPVKYIGATNRYFLMSVVAQTPVEANALIQPAGNSAGRISLVYPLMGKTMTIPVRVYFGPKDLDLLRKAEPTLDHTVDFGWFTVFAYPLLKILKWFYQFVANYGLAIILLTLLLKVVTYPLTYKSMKSMKKMAKLQPQLQKIRDKYKDDREALNREMLTMMRGNGYNPMAGCLPILIQMPIFFALYRVLYSSIELYHAPFALWIHDLSSRDPFYVTPVLLSITMFIQQKMTPTTTTDPAQARMMQFMPLIFGAFMLALPSGLTVYMLVNAIAGIVQQVILNKKLEAVT